MRLRLGVGVTEEWMERAVPMLEECGLRLVGREVTAEGEYVTCLFDYEGPGPLQADALLSTLDRVRACVAASMVPDLEVAFVADGCD